MADSTALAIIQRYDYGEPKRGKSFEVETFLPALSRLFDRVIVFGVDEHVLKLGNVDASEHLAELAKSLRPSFAFSVLFENQLDPVAYDAVRDYSGLSVNWFCDDHWRFNDFSRYWARHFDLVSTTSREAFRRYRKLSGVTAVKTQWACANDRLVEARVSSPRMVASFIGQRGPDRDKAMSRLAASGIDVETFGLGWPAGRLPLDEMLERQRSAALNLNFSDSHRVSMLRPRIHQVKARPFELAGSGQVIVTQRHPELDEYFEPGVEIADFTSADEMVEVCERLMRDEAERERMAQACLVRVKAEHTYDHRLRAILAAGNLVPESSQAGVVTYEAP